MHLSRNYIQATPTLMEVSLDNDTYDVLIHVGMDNILNLDSKISRLLVNIKDTVSNLCKTLELSIPLCIIWSIRR